MLMLIGQTERVVIERFGLIVVNNAIAWDDLSGTFAAQNTVHILVETTGSMC